MFNDKRGKRIIILAHCILNQNTKLDRLVTCYPGAITEIAELCIKSGAGIVQMPCPELLLMGIDRQCKSGTHPSIESEKDRVSLKMNDAEGKKFCESLAENMILQIEEYQKNDFKVLGIVGVNKSPTCGVETTWSDGQKRKGRGVFLDILSTHLNNKKIKIPIIGIKTEEPEKALEAVSKLFA
ncbi:MAG TPA: hypothetical protein DD381_00450 [Lentisphaeria bacterium]|nr:MAG: hypothetical protein A2X47_05085 [Lentisphaerae bacterium GWF2_38_69]HBM14812.1 hypothetical protein [Lentisphaeria bacterium]